MSNTTAAVITQTMQDMASALYGVFSESPLIIRTTPATMTWEVHNHVDHSTEVLVLVKETGHLVNITTEWDQVDGWTTRSLEVTVQDVADYVEENETRWRSQTAALYGHI